ncbi:hypothetical protein NC99_35880 [Sunxiuqinia dokdonensis]|uniref:Uncharacterized protein n=1 Tax=Sunxiuqinia dokdonensis TaxID=1409788 RepID=A0A0L8V5Q4_9BACT|nr:hypothetical protein NC99_35880 [Sunxiuqinia dokdonensis]
MSTEKIPKTKAMNNKKALRLKIFIKPFVGRLNRTEGRNTFSKLINT